MAEASAIIAALIFSFLLVAPIWHDARRVADMDLKRKEMNDD